MERKIDQKHSTFNLLCYIKKNKTLKNGEAPIYMRITVNRQTADLSLQGSVNPNVWSQAKEQSRGYN